MASSRLAAGMEKCCQVPGRSQNFTSTTRMFFCLTRSKTFWTSLLGELRTGAEGRAVVAMVVLAVLKVPLKTMPLRRRIERRGIR